MPSNLTNIDDYVPPLENAEQRAAIAIREAVLRGYEATLRNSELSTNQERELREAVARMSEDVRSAGLLASTLSYDPVQMRFVTRDLAQIERRIRWDVGTERRAAAPREMTARELAYELSTPPSPLSTRKPKIVAKKSAMVANNLLHMGFKLCGSRRMAEKFPDAVQIKPDTDWDLYISDAESEYADRTLTAFGFRRAANNSGYRGDARTLDDLMVRLYKHDELNIDVGVRRKVKTYERVIEGMTADFYVKKIWKSAPRKTPLKDVQAFKRKVCKRLNRLFAEAEAAGA